ncbi:MAG: hypothetical protein Rhims3KO_05880 [Hyphomicrobiales bacterium]
MVNKPNCDTLAARFNLKAEAASGLKDVKFYVRNLDEASSEAVCTEVNALYDAVENGKSYPLKFDDSKRS